MQGDKNFYKDVNLAFDKLLAPLHQRETPLAIARGVGCPNRANIESLCL
jgi:hypothetical protein